MALFVSLHFFFLCFSPLQANAILLEFHRIISIKLALVQNKPTTNPMSFNNNNAASDAESLQSDAESHSSATLENGSRSGGQTPTSMPSHPGLLSIAVIP